MIRTSLLPAMIMCLSTIASHAQDVRQLTCTGAMIAPAAASQAPKSIKLSLGPARKIALDLGEGNVNPRVVSDNKIQLKFRASGFEGEYFHYTGDLFLIYKSGHLMRLTCQKPSAG